MQDRDAGAVRFAALCRAEHPRLLGVLTQYTGDRDVAHDLAQESLTVDDNLVVVNGFGHNATVRLSGPEGGYTLTAPPR